MRTTVDFPGNLLREVKTLAVKQGRTLKEIVLTAVQREVSRANHVDRKRYSAKLPLIPSKRPGTLRSLTNAEIDDLLD